MASARLLREQEACHRMEDELGQALQFSPYYLYYKILQNKMILVSISGVPYSLGMSQQQHPAGKEKAAGNASDH
jgi:hypothetical protein